MWSIQVRSKPSADDLSCLAGHCLFSFFTVQDFGVASDMISSRQKKSIYILSQNQIVEMRNQETREKKPRGLRKWKKISDWRLAKICQAAAHCKAGFIWNRDLEKQLSQDPYFHLQKSDTEKRLELWVTARRRWNYSIVKQCYLTLRKYPLSIIKYCFLFLGKYLLVQ